MEEEGKSNLSHGLRVKTITSAIGSSADNTTVCLPSKIPRLAKWIEYCVTVNDHMGRLIFAQVHKTFEQQWIFEISCLIPLVDQLTGILSIRERKFSWSCFEEQSCTGKFHFLGELNCALQLKCWEESQFSKQFVQFVDGSDSSTFGLLVKCSTRHRNYPRRSMIDNVWNSQRNSSSVPLSALLHHSSKAGFFNYLSASFTGLV